MTQFSDRAYDYYIGLGYSPAGAAAMAGNADWESGGDPRKVHDQGTGVGIFGWRDPEAGKGRKTDLINWATTAGEGGAPLNPYDVGTQLKFADWELQNKYKAQYDALKSAPDLQSAQTAMMHYLRPAGYQPDNPQAGHAFAQRFNLGAQYTGDAPMTVPINGSGPGGSGVMTASADATPPYNPYAEAPAGKTTDQEIAEWSKAGGGGLLSGDQQKAIASASQQATKFGMSLLGDANKQPSMDFGPAAGAYRPQVQQVQMPDFTQMLAQQRLTRRM